MSVTQLPIDVLCDICSFVGDPQTLINLRHSNSYLYQASETNRFWTSTDVVVLETENAASQFFKQLLEHKENSSIYLNLLHSVLKGSLRLLEQNGVAQGKYVLDMFFECLFALLTSEQNKDITLAMLRDYSSISTYIDAIDAVGGVLPRFHILRMIYQLKDNPDLLTNNFRSLVDHKIDLCSLKFSYQDYDPKEYSFIPFVAWNFSVMHFAVWIKNKSLMDILIKMLGASINTADANGCTCLHYAAISDDIDLVKYLVEQCSADPYCTDVEQISPLRLAQLHNKQEVIEYFKQRVGTDEVTEHIAPFLNYQSDLSTAAKYDEDGDHGYSSFWEFSEAEVTHDLEDQQLLDYDTREEYASKNDGMLVDYEKADDFMYDYPAGTFMFELRENLVFGFKDEDEYVEHLNYERYCNSDGDSQYSGNISYEEGISLDYLRSAEIQEIEEVCDLFEAREIKMHQDNGVEQVYYNVVETERTPLRTLEIMKQSEQTESSSVHENRNAYQKRMIKHQEEQPKKRRRLEESLKSAVVTRSELHMSKQAFRLLIAEIIQNCCFEASATPLSNFIIQGAAEDFLDRLFGSAIEYSKHYNRNHLNVWDIRYALRRMCFRLHDNRDASSSLESDDESYDTQSKESSETCSSSDLDEDEAEEL